MMHTLLLALALAPQGPNHADLHPVETDIYLELADASSALAALDGAPVLHLLRDARLKPLFDQLGQSPDRPLKELLKTGLSMAAPEAKPEAWIDGLKTVSVSIVALGPGSDTQSPVGFQLLADLATPEQAKALHDFVVSTASKHEPVSGSLSGLERLHMGGKGSEDLWCAVAGSRLVVGGSSAKVEDYIARADKKLPGLASRETFKKGLAAFDKPSGAPLLWFALERPLTEILQTIKKDGAESLSFLGQLPSELNPFASARAARVQFIGDRFVTEMISLGDTSASAQKPVDPAWLEPVPSDSMLIYSSAIDGAAAGKEVRALVSKDEKGAATMAALEQKLGFGPERVLGRLGPGFTAYVAPPAGLGLPETRVWIDCEDPAGFTSDFEALIGAFGETLPGFAVKTKPYKVKKAGSDEKVEVPVTTVTLPQGMIQNPMLNVSPSFAPVGKKLVFGLSSMDVKNELKRIISGEGEPIVAGKNALNARGFALPADARSVVVMDWAKLIGGVLGMVKSFASMAGPDATGGFDLAKLPPPELFAQYLKPTFHYSKPVAAGLYRRNEASFGPETWGGLLGGAAFAGMYGRNRFAPDETDEGVVPLEKTEGGQ